MESNTLCNSASNDKNSASISNLVRAIDVVQALYDYLPSKHCQLKFYHGDIIFVLSKNESGWWDGIIVNNVNKSCKRGWFPQNYTKSIKDRTFRQLHAVKSDKKNHHELKSSAVSQSRRNSVGIGNMRLGHGDEELFPHLSSSVSSHSCLKQDYKLDMKRRPNTLSNASSRSSTSMNVLSKFSQIHQSGQQWDPLQKIPLNGNSSDNPRLSDCEIQRPYIIEKEKLKVLSATDSEIIMNNIQKVKDIYIWEPIATTSGDIMYFNKNFNVYCKSLPINVDSNLHMKSVFQNEERLLESDQKPVLMTLGEHSKIVDQGRSSLYNKSRKPSASSVQSFSLSAESNENTPNISEAVIGSQLIGSQNSSFHQLSQDSQKTRDSRRYQQTHELRDLQEDRLEESDCWLNYNKPFLSKRELFYYQYTDIGTWSELRDSTLYYIQALYEAFVNNDRERFHETFDIFSRFINYYQMVCKLMKDRLVKQPEFQYLKRLLKKIINSMAVININASLYFNSSKRIMSNSQRIPMKCSTMLENPTNLIKDWKNNAQNMSSVQQCASTSTLQSYYSESVNLSTGTEDTLLRNADREQFSPQQVKDPTLHTSHFGVSSTHSQISNLTIDDESGILIESIFHVIEFRYLKLMKNIWKLHKLMIDIVNHDETLPQLYPRFFKGSLDTSTWVNSFGKDMSISIQHNIVSSYSMGYFPLSPDAVISAAAGISAVGLGPRQFSNASSKTSGSNIRYASFSNKPNSKTFLRSRATKRIKYPLNEDTLKLFKNKVLLIVEQHNPEYSFLQHPRSEKNNLEMAARTYRMLGLISSLIDIMEGIDLTFFINLKNLSGDSKLDKESKELRKHSVTVITTLLVEFFDIKQALHDIGVQTIMDAQQMTLKDPYVFSSMKGKSYQEETYSEIRKPRTIKQDKAMDMLSNYLISQDVEFNTITFLDSEEVIEENANKFLRIIHLAEQTIEQLISERESIISYTARLMKSELIALLVKGEQNKWFEIEEVTPSHSDLESGNYETKNRLSNVLSTDVPWYLDSDAAYSLHYDSKGHIKGGTKKSLIECLTSHQTMYSYFDTVMIITFRSIFTTTEFLDFLIDRYNISPPEGLSYDDYNDWTENKSKKIKLKVIEVLNILFSEYWNPGYYEPGIEKLVDFAQAAAVEQIPKSKNLSSLIEKCYSMKNSLEQLPESSPLALSLSLAPVSLDPQSFLINSSNFSGVMGPTNSFKMRKLKLLDIDPLVFAKQLSIKEHSLYCKISIFECLNRTWKAKYSNLGCSRNISKFISNSNHLTNYVSHVIVRQTDIKKRVQLLQFFINVANHCCNLNNFSSMTAIISALFSSPIFRLKKTWAIVPESFKEKLENLNTLMDSTKNFYRYRELIRSIHDVPCIPFFGIYLSDLTFIVNGNSDYIHGSKDIINFTKRIRIVEVLKEISRYQKMTYKWLFLTEIQQFIETSLENTPSIEKQYEQSLLIEPRTDISTGLNSTNPSYHQRHQSDKPLFKSGKRLRFGKAKK